MVDVPLERLPPQHAGLRIAHLSDLHFRRWNAVLQNAQECLGSLAYDLLVLTGDYAARPRRWQAAAKLLARFVEPLGELAPIYAVLGNHDDPRIAGNCKVPLVWLRNESVTLQIRGAPLELAGVEQSRARQDGLAATIKHERRHDLVIMAAHYPSTVFRLPPGRVDLLLSGHTHGGQIRWPYFGCLWAHDRIPRRLARGLHRPTDTWLHVTPGIGVSPPLPIRINCPPEISLITLLPAALAAGSAPSA